VYIKLTTGERLKDLRVERRLTLEQLAELTGISKSALGSYELDESIELSPSSVTTLARLYGVSTDYLLGLTEAKNHPNTELHELGLSDEMIDVLRSGRINNRLLCELATHPGFRRFLVDMEIFVDRIADMRVHDMNAVLEATRRAVMEKQDVDADDLYVRTMELAQVSEEDYFSHVMHNDLDVIARDIRDRHRKDTTTADTASPAADAAARLQEAMRYEGSAEEKQARLFLSQLGIDYDKLTQEEFVSLIGILKKSALLKSPVKHRGKPTIQRKK
jgi:transcriptional regulator with XRE-family HTH domain